MGKPGSLNDDVIHLTAAGIRLTIVARKVRKIHLRTVSLSKGDFGLVSLVVSQGLPAFFLQTFQAAHL